MLGDSTLSIIEEGGDLLGFPDQLLIPPKYQLLKLNQRNTIATKMGAMIAAKMTSTRCD